MSKQRVLFLCNANSARSLMGEALLRNMAGDEFDAFSAGVAPDAPQQHALHALARAGVDNSGLASESIDRYRSQSFDAVIVLCQKAQQQCRQWDGQTDELLFWDIEDPRNQDTAVSYGRALNEIRTRLQLWLAARSHH